MRPFMAVMLTMVSRATLVEPSGGWMSNEAAAAVVAVLPTALALPAEAEPLRA
jgi:hypothetical protein